MKCPLCQTELSEMPGSRIHPGDRDYGITLWCPSSSCPSQEVMGHGDKVKDAFEVIQAKYTDLKSN